MAEHHDLTLSGRTDCDKRMSTGLPAVLHDAGPHQDPRLSRRAASGDCSRRRRLADPIRRRYYAWHRQYRFARRMLGVAPALYPDLSIRSCRPPDRQAAPPTTPSPTGGNHYE